MCCSGPHRWNSPQPDFFHVTVIPVEKEQCAAFPKWLRFPTYHYDGSKTTPWIFFITCLFSVLCQAILLWCLCVRLTPSITYYHWSQDLTWSQIFKIIVYGFHSHCNDSSRPCGKELGVHLKLESHFAGALLCMCVEFLRS